MKISFNEAMISIESVSIFVSQVVFPMTPYTITLIPMESLFEMLKRKENPCKIYLYYLILLF